MLDVQAFYSLRPSMLVPVVQPFKGTCISLLRKLALTSILPSILTFSKNISNHLWEFTFGNLKYFWLDSSKRTNILAYLKIELETNMKGRREYLLSEISNLRVSYLYNYLYFTCHGPSPDLLKNLVLQQTRHSFSFSQVLTINHTHTHTQKTQKNAIKG